MSTPAPGERKRRVLLVEDDASIRRFVSMVLEDEPLELLEAATLLQAIGLLRSGPFDLVLCDLMLPDGSGLDLLRALCEPDSPSPGVRCVAFSAGVSAATRQRLEGLGVREVLAKPTSVSALLDCVRAPARLPATAQPGAEAARPEGVDAAIAQGFGGDLALYRAFADACALQWTKDVTEGDQALVAGDRAGMRRLAHSLKSVLQTLGHGEPADCARRLEAAAQAAPPDPGNDAVPALWQDLRGRLLALAARAGSG